MGKFSVGVLVGAACVLGTFFVMDRARTERFVMTPDAASSAETTVPASYLQRAASVPTIQGPLLPPETGMFSCGEKRCKLGQACCLASARCVRDGMTCEATMNGDRPVIYCGADYDCAEGEKCCDTTPSGSRNYSMGCVRKTRVGECPAPR